MAKPFRALLRAPGAARFLIARTVAAVGSWIDRIAIGWLVWELTGSAGWVGLIAFLRLAPTLALGPIGGALADRMGGVRLLRRCQWAVAAADLALVALALTQGLGLAALCLASLAIGVLQALANAPAKTAIVEIAPRALLGAAIPSNALGFNLATLIGPAVGAGLLAAGGPAAAFGASALAAAGFAVALQGLAPTSDATAPRGPRLDRAIVEGVRYVAVAPDLRALLGLHLGASLLLRPVVELLPAVAGATLAGVAGAGGAAAVGWLGGALGAGALIGGALLAGRGRVEGLGRRALGGAVVAVAATAMLAADLGAAVAVASMLALGFGMMVRASATQTLLQAHSAPHMRGRVMGLYGVALRGGAAVGALALGAIADLVGMTGALGAAAVLAGLGLALFWGALAAAAQRVEAEFNASIEAEAR